MQEICDFCEDVGVGIPELLGVRFTKIYKSLIFSALNYRVLTDFLDNSVSRAAILFTFAVPIMGKT